MLRSSVRVVFKLHLAFDAASTVRLLAGGLTMTAAKLFRTGEFADLAGVTTRTLRYYDQIELLQPSMYAESGQRLYTEADFARLQQILTLKLIGLGLAEIKTLLTTDVAAVQTLLERQKQALQTQVRQLASIIQTIETAQGVIRSSERLALDQLIDIIRAVNMNQQTDWTAQFLTDDQRAKLAAAHSNQTLAEQKQMGEAWKQLFESVLTHLDHDVHDPAVQALVTRWDDLTGNDSQLEAALSAAYLQMDTLSGMPVEAQDWLQTLGEAARFIQRLRAARTTSR
jgi:DNA-binding transcriptional MerR regulator